MESILNSIKKLLDIDAEYDRFDVNVILHINSVFADLTQLGVGPAEGFQITDAETTWAEYLGDSTLLANVRTYMYLKVKLLFDPPQQSAVLESMNRQADKYEWLIRVAAEPKNA